MCRPVRLPRYCYILCFYYRYSKEKRKIVVSCSWHYTILKWQRRNIKNCWTCLGQQAASPFTPEIRYVTDWPDEQCLLSFLGMLVTLGSTATTPPPLIYLEPLVYIRGRHLSEQRGPLADVICPSFLPRYTSVFKGNQPQHAALL